MKNFLKSSIIACMSFLIIGVIALGVGIAGEVEFQYSGDQGPGYWWELDPGWQYCAGTSEIARQSPLDIRRATYDYDLTPLNLQIFETTVDLVNNGHTIEQHYSNSGSNILFEGVTYELRQFHFHTLSEHAVKGKRAAMEMHAVFNDPESGNNLVVGVLFEPGKRRNRFLETLIDAGLPAKSGDTTHTDETINLLEGLTDTTAYYTYLGSLTTPACAENVTWIVLKESARLSAEQLASFQTIMGNNFRPFQKLNGRVVRATFGKGNGFHHR